jgi:hypothetical protein
MNYLTIKRKFLNSISDDKRIYFFNSTGCKCSLIGSVKGQLVSILVASTDRPLSREEIQFSAKIIRAGGEFYVIRDSIEDLTEIAKIKGWYDA